MSLLPQRTVEHILASVPHERRGVVRPVARGSSAARDRTQAHQLPQNLGTRECDELTQGFLKRLTGTVMLEGSALLLAYAGSGCFRVWSPSTDAAKVVPFVQGALRSTVLN